MTKGMLQLSSLCYKYCTLNVIADGGQHFQIMDEDGNLIATPGGTVQVVKLATESEQRATLIGTKADGSIVQPETLVSGI